jgi:hypothetical protein
VWIARAACGIALAACAASPPSDGLSARKRTRVTLIRDVSAQLGLHNAALLAGIADAETNLAHCWSEATYGCQGPVSSSCGGPILAGSADGPCAAMQGGLGMFQFDAGTWNDTLATYGAAILTEDGSTRQAVHFVAAQVMHDVAAIADEAAAIAWLNGVPLVVGEARTEQWAQIMACRYNGCCAASATCTTRATGYRDRAIALENALGAAFWRAAP